MNETTFIFKQHSAGRVGHRERLAEKQCVHSTILQGGSSEEEFTSTAGSSRKEPPPLRRWNLPHFHFQQFCIQLIQQSGPADVDGSTPAQINHGKGARTGCHTRSSFKLYRTNCWGHADPFRSTPALRPLIRTRNEYRLRARPTDDVDPSSTDRFLKKLLLLSSLLFLVFFSSAPSLRCSFRFSSALLILPFSSENSFHPRNRSRYAWRWP